MTEQKYQVREVTPESARCIAGIGCPAIYEVIDKTSKKFDCVVGSCARIYDYSQGRYAIIGRIEKPEEFGLEGKVGKGEVLISIPRELIDLLNNK